MHRIRRDATSQQKPQQLDISLFRRSNKDISNLPDTTIRILPEQGRRRLRLARFPHKPRHRRPVTVFSNAAQRARVNSGCL
jgi:hypothetical protein